jgi:hypothetical protein
MSGPVKLRRSARPSSQWPQWALRLTDATIGSAQFCAMEKVGCEIKMTGVAHSMNGRAVASTEDLRCLQIYYLKISA